MTNGISKSLLIGILTFISLTLHAQNLIPLKVGNYWKYKQITSVSDSIISIDTVVNSVKKRISLNGKDWFILNEFGDDFVVRNSKLGQVEIDTLSKDIYGKFKETVMFKNPNELKTLSYIVYDVNYIEVDKTPILINTIIGDFKSFKYTILIEDEIDEKIETYISPKIGIIYQDWSIGKKHVRCKLVDYKIN